MRMIEPTPPHSYSFPSPPCTKSAPYMACYSSPPATASTLTKASSRSSQPSTESESLWVKEDDVGVDPMVGERLIGGDVVDELVRDHDGDLEVGVTEGGANFGVGVIELDSLGLEKLDELHQLRQWWEVVAQLAVVHTHLGGELCT
ncbi:glucan endo-1,3-beta-glucosidase A6 [Pyrus ussuriensis x Pyrus communis]|uniref:Glucan endo-1,3-beta-glucosidase A6 n=1 Tax=Pyrus ussuriensis x Pyrus communis TaxID=2448454 RepID=A0A5N5H508_9ROSA|nr:glucan endo-1,3-beta-glucosidase A6 [Pyrus ussuriensis x Pyrus communis]